MPDTQVDVDFLIKYLTERDVACPVCGYSLRNLISRRCPECGRELMFHVGTTEPRMVAFIAGVTALGAGIGANAFLLLIFAYGYLTHPSSGNGRYERILDATLLCGAGFGAMLFAWLFYRRFFRARSRGVQWALAILFWVLVAASFVLLIRIIA